MHAVTRCIVGLRHSVSRVRYMVCNYGVLDPFIVGLCDLCGMINATRFGDFVSLPVVSNLPTLILGLLQTILRRDQPEEDSGHSSQRRDLDRWSIVGL